MWATHRTHLIHWGYWMKAQMEKSMERKGWSQVSPTLTMIFPRGVRLERREDDLESTRHCLKRWLWFAVLIEWFGMTKEMVISILLIRSPLPTCNPCLFTQQFLHDIYSHRECLTIEVAHLSQELILNFLTFNWLIEILLNKCLCHWQKPDNYQVDNVKSRALRFSFNFERYLWGRSQSSHEWLAHRFRIDIRPKRQRWNGRPPLVHIQTSN